MDAFTQYKYITLAGASLEGFRPAGKNLWAFRCPICGDSKKNKNKRRGYFYLKDGNYRFHCHNCGIDKSFQSFLYEVSPELYSEYRKEHAFKSLTNDDKTEELCAKQTKPIPSISKVNNLIQVKELNDDHPAIMYLRSRHVPVSKYESVYWTDDFNALISETLGDAYKDIEKPSSGLIFVVRAVDSSDYPIIGYQIRSIDPNVPKHKRFMICKESGYTGVFGLDSLDTSKQIYVVEGPIDSLFLPNCVAVFTSALWRVNFPDAIYVNDCEPRNKQITDQVKRCIDKGYRTVLLPKEYNSLDINDIVCKYNLNENELVKLLEKYTFRGLSAKMHFTKWRL